MPALTADQRIEYVRAIWDTFCSQFKIHRECSNAEYELARKWALRGVPLAMVLEGIVETTGKPRRLEACQRAVEENIARWHASMKLRTELPEPGPLEPPEEPFDVEAARKRRDEMLAAMRKAG